MTTTPKRPCGFCGQKGVVASVTTGPNNIRHACERHADESEAAGLEVVRWALVA